jgi:hypothetical protein
MLAASLVIGLMIYAWQRNDLRRIIRDFACDGHRFNGQIEPCLVRFPLDESKTDCLIGANREGLFLSSSPEAIERSKWWSYRSHAIRTPVLIPWNCLLITDASFPLRAYFRITVLSNKATFFIPKEAGGLLLANARRDVPFWRKTDRRIVHPK